MFARGLEIISQDKDELLEEQGGRRREFADIESALKLEFGLGPWFESIFSIEATDVYPPAYVASDANWSANWFTVRDIRRALERALASRR